MTKTEHALCVGAALFGALLAYHDAHSQGLAPVPLQTQPKEPYAKQEEVKKNPQPQTRTYPNSRPELPPQGSAVRRAPNYVGVPCRYVPNGVNVTISCANGFWQTQTPDGLVFQGMGTPDPNASMPGSTIVTNPATGGPYVGAGPTVAAPPPGQAPMLAPWQAQQYGYPLPD